MSFEDAQPHPGEEAASAHQVRPSASGALDPLTVSGVIMLDRPSDDDEEQQEADADLVWLHEHGAGGLTLPPKGSRPPARTAAELAGLLRAVQAPDQAMAATAGWLLSDRRSSAATQRNYIRDVSWWLWWVQARGLHLGDVPFLETDLYGAAMRAAGLAPNSRRARISAASSWYRYLRRAEVAKTNPFEGMESPKRQLLAPTRYITGPQLDEMVAEAVLNETPRTQAIMAVLRGTACRISSLLNVELSQLTYQGRFRVLQLPVKGGGIHPVKVSSYTGELIDGYLAERGADPGPIFLSRTGNKLQRTYIRQLIQRLAKATGVPDHETLSIHGIRHSVATALLDADEDLAVVQALLGHASPETTQVYAHPDTLNRSPADKIDQRLAATVARRTRHLPHG
ncbi:tyrosine-type recombinase/integrase [Streptosporangium sp. CA-115845]|uniref:tyrosine-type recombinase/integrase n=1 Tax=Streptosporangium sp. CA-115845 TaxID=3240071 RepID=UPI003D9329B9